MHRVRRLALKRDVLTGLDLKPSAALDQNIGVIGAAQLIRQPCNERLSPVVLGAVRLDNRLLAEFHRMIEVLRQDHAVCIESIGVKYLLQVRSEIDQHQQRPDLVGGLSDLLEAVRRRRVDTGHQVEIEYQEAALGPASQQPLHLLIELAGRAKEQVALQGNALQLTAMRCQKREFGRASIEKATIFRAVEAELDGVHTARAESERGATKNDAEQQAGNEAPIDDDQCNGNQRQIVERLQTTRRSNQPSINQGAAGEEQEAAE